MRKLSVMFSALCCVAYTSAQQPKKISAYLLTQYNNTLYDQTRGNNPWSMGLGLQAFINTKSKLKPTLEITGDAYLENDKVSRIYTDGSPVIDVGGMLNLLAGVSFHPANRTYLSFVTGPSFINGQTLLAVKPSFGFYFSNNQRWTGKLSYINVFNRGTQTKENFGSVSVTIGVKLF